MLDTELCRRVSRLMVDLDSLGALTLASGAFPWDLHLVLALLYELQPGSEQMEAGGLTPHVAEPNP